MKAAEDARGRQGMGRLRMPWTVNVGLLLFAAMAVACRKSAPPAALNHQAVPLEVRLADTLDSIEGFRGAVLAVYTRAQHTELRALGEKMTEEHFARAADIAGWRRIHFGHIPPTEPLPTTCTDDVLFGKSLPMNPSDTDIIEATLLQSQCEVLFAGTILQQSKDPELVGIARAVIASTGPEVTTLLKWKAEWSKR